MLLRVCLGAQGFANVGSKSSGIVKIKRSHQIFQLRPTTSASASRSSDKASELRKLLRLWTPEKYRLGGAICMLFVSSAVTMSVPFALGKVIDVIYKIDQTKTVSDQKAEFEAKLRKVCLFLVGIFVVGGLTNMGRVYLMRIAAQNITARLRSLLYSSIMRQNLLFFDRNKTGELVNRLSADSQLVSSTITQAVSDGLRSTVMTAAGVGMMFYMSPQLAFVGLGIVPPVAAWAVVMGRKVRAAGRNVQDALANATQLAEERISNIRTVYAFAKQQQEVTDYDKRMDNVLEVSRKEAKIHAKFYGMTGLSGNMIILSVLYYGGSLVTSDVLTVGNLTSFVLYAAYVGIGLSGVSSFYAEINKGLGASSRIFDIIESKHSLLPDEVLHKKFDLTQTISMRDIHFRYPTRPDVKIFDALNLTVPSKKVLAIVGTSGSGKSSLSSLLLRLYEPEEGSIKIGNTDIRKADVDYLRKKIGIVTQEPVLFSTSIRNNICYGCDDPDLVTDDILIAASREANAHDFITDFPNGYDTLVGERGVLLSGGQKQRVAIARAIIKNPEILILDEATSALDAASEHLVKEALQRIMHGRTVITIAHRLSTIMSADKIVVLHGGKIVEEGTFEELNAIQDGFFKQLVQKQTISAGIRD